MQPYCVMFCASKPASSGCLTVLVNCQFLGGINKLVPCPGLVNGGRGIRHTGFVEHVLVVVHHEDFVCSVRMQQACPWYLNVMQSSGLASPSEYMLLTSASMSLAAHAYNHFFFQVCACRAGCRQPPWC